MATKDYKPKIAVRSVPAHVSNIHVSILLNIVPQMDQDITGKVHIDSFTVVFMVHMVNIEKMFLVTFSLCGESHSQVNT